MLTRALVVSDDAQLRARLERLLRLPDVLVSAMREPRDAGALAREEVDLVVVGESRASALLLHDLRGRARRPDVVVVVAEEDAHRRAQLLTDGCTAVLFAGLDDDEVSGVLASLLARRRAERAGVATPGEPDSLDALVSASPAMRQLLDTARRVADSDTSLLVLGETGAGKERLARAIHATGARAGSPFVAVNCGAIPEALLESEFFGHERGAFTGAVRTRRGHFELAHTGTIFLDEIGDLPTHLQVKLLRVLQDHEIRPVGSERSIAVDVRVVAATSQDLQGAIETGRFRRDLYYRLGVVTLVLPPLRERPEDVGVLAEQYRERFAARQKRTVRAISPAAADILRAYPWPGNVRELANVMERAVLLCRGDEIGPEDLGDLVRPASGTRPQLDGLLARGWSERPWHAVREEALAAVERLYLSRLLELTHGRVGEAARRAQLNPRSLYDKMRSHGLTKEAFQRGPTRER